MGLTREVLFSLIVASYISLNLLAERLTYLKDNKHCCCDSAAIWQVCVFNGEICSRKLKRVEEGGKERKIQSR